MEKMISSTSLEKTFYPLSYGFTTDGENWFSIQMILIIHGTESLMGNPLKLVFIPGIWNMNPIMKKRNTLSGIKQGL